MNFAIVNLGCKVNRVESDSFAAALLAQGDRMVAAEEAELILINTCTVTKEADKKTRKAIRRALRLNSKARIIVTGCAAALNAEELSAFDRRVEVLPKAQLPQNNTLLRTGKSFRTRVGLKVQDGCDHACTYCIVHLARGAATSVPAHQLIAEARRLAAAGVRELVITGINVGSYDSEGLRLASLIERLLAEMCVVSSDEKATRIRLSSIEPNDVDDNLILLLAKAQGRVCRHLHLPLQSGSTRVLKDMGRPYTAESFCQGVQKLYEAIPTLALSTDIIVGFPGETEEDFAQTLETARFCQFCKIHVFPYSPREGTPAAVRTDQVAPEVRTRRTHQLLELAKELRKAAWARRRGCAELALVEANGLALTESYFELAAPAGTIPGDLIELILP